MIQVVDKTNTPRTILAREAPYGAFKGNVGTYSGLFLRTFNSIVYLVRPEVIWDTKRDDVATLLQITNYVPVNLTIEATSCPTS